MKNRFSYYCQFYFFPATAIPLYAAEEKWQGIDEAVLEKFASEAGREPVSTVLNSGHGDLLLFFFLLFGAIGGFIAGYFFRQLFPPKGKGKGEKDV